MSVVANYPKENEGNHLSFICLLHSLRDFDPLFSKFPPRALIISDSFSQQNGKFFTEGAFSNDMKSMVSKIFARSAREKDRNQMF